MPVRECCKAPRKESPGAHAHSNDSLASSCKLLSTSWVGNVKLSMFPRLLKKQAINVASGGQQTQNAASV